jgi:radical SAM protein with 4Fe4S-binding SPASM domain
VKPKSGEKSISRYELILGSALTRRLLKSLTDVDGNGRCALEEVFDTYATPDAPLSKRVRYFIPHRVIDTFAKLTGADRQTLKAKVFGHRPTARTLINTAASIAHYGLTKPQRFVAPMIVVWNITQACNLACSHCYQNARRKLPDELTQDEQIDLVDQLADAYVSMLAFAGGEPLMSESFWRTCRHAVERGLHVTVATNGTLLTPRNVERLRETGIKILEVSLDSVDPAKHNRFRGAGTWEKTVEGIKNAVAQSTGRNYRVSVASTITQMNYGEAEDLMKFAIDLGAHSFNAFNFIPTGRGRQIADDDLSPEQREALLDLLYRYMQTEKMTIMCTAPQFARACIEHRKSEGDLMAVGHGGAGRARDITLYTEYLGGCGAGRCYCAIQPNGKVTPCVFMPLEVGDVRTRSFIDIWRNTPEFQSLSDRSDRTGHCRVCDFRYQCGGCRARAYNYTGDFRSGDPGCVRNRKLWNEIAARRQEGLPILTEEWPSPSADVVSGNAV